MKSLYKPHHLYIHFPYCLYKCHYCDFNSHAYQRAEIPNLRYHEALKSEILLQKIGTDFQEIETIFFGGGTPSLMNTDLFSDLMDFIRSHFRISQNCEVTLESNPGTLTRERAKEFFKAGVNRFSVGIQSTQDRYLKNFGRIHTAQEAFQCLDFLFEESCEVSLDLIFGFPNQTLKEWQDNLKFICQRYPINHLSCYSLTAEPGTLYTKELKEGKLNTPDSDVAAEMQIWTNEFLKDEGLQVYEISNFAKAGFECQHNLAYWQFHSYLGIGAGAVSNFMTNQQTSYRQTNHKAPEHYMRTVENREAFFTREESNGLDLLKDYVMMALRTREGMRKESLEFLFGKNRTQSLQELLKHNENLLIDENQIRIKQSSLLFYNAILIEIFSEIENLRDQLL